MKQAASIILVSTTLAFALTACGGSDKQPGTSAPQAVQVSVMEVTQTGVGHSGHYSGSIEEKNGTFLSFSTLTDVLGGSGRWMPMGTVICYGTLITMVFLLTVLPCAYLLTFRGTSKKRERWNASEEQ